MAYHPDDLFLGEEKGNFRPFVPGNLLVDEKLFQLLLSLDPQRLEPVPGSEVSQGQRKLQLLIIEENDLRGLGDLALPKFAFEFFDPDLLPKILDQGAAGGADFNFKGRNKVDLALFQPHPVISLLSLESMG